MAGKGDGCAQGRRLRSRDWVWRVMMPRGSCLCALGMSEALNFFYHLPFSLEFQGLLLFPPVDATTLCCYTFLLLGLKWTSVLTDDLHHTNRKALNGGFPSVFQKGWVTCIDFSTGKAMRLKPRQACWLVLDPEFCSAVSKEPLPKVRQAFLSKFPCCCCAFSP